MKPFDFSQIDSKEYINKNQSSNSTNKNNKTHKNNYSKPKNSNQNSNKNSNRIRIYKRRPKSFYAFGRSYKDQFHKKYNAIKNEYIKSKL
jgi:hypothetical protein